MGLCGSQRNPLFDEGAVAQGQEQSLISTSALTPAIIPTHTRNPAAEVMQRGKWVPSRGISACSGYVLAADSAAGLSVRSSADGTVMGEHTCPALADLTASAFRSLQCMGAA